MIPENRIPTHPGEILQDRFLDPMGTTRESLARHLGLKTKRIDAIVAGERPVTPAMAWLLAQALDTSPEFWINLQSNHDLGANRPDREVSPLRKAG